MSLLEIDHPIASEVSTVCAAVENGLLEGCALPEYIKLRYTSPLDDGDGCTVLHVVDWCTENMTTITVPVFSTLENGPKVFYGGDRPMLTGARIVIRDFLLRSLALGSENGTIGVPFSQVDVVPEGLVHYAEHNNMGLVSMGEYDKELYGVYSDLIRTQASLAVLYDLSVEFLGK